MNALQIIALVLVLLVVIFFLQNILSYSSISYISFLFMRAYVKTGWLILSCLLLGGLIGFMLAQAGRRR